MVHLLEINNITINIKQTLLTIKVYIFVIYECIIRNKSPPLDK